MISHRTFGSMCEVCLEDVPGALRLEGEEVYHYKHCPEHGDRRVLMSRNSDAYVRYDRHYHSLFASDETPPDPVDNHFFITNSCNQRCGYCASEANRYDYYRQFEIEPFAEQLKSYRGSKVSLIGGEPLLHPRFFDFVGAIEAAGKTAVIFTNGVGFADAAKVRRLVETSRRRCEVRMTFEGFQAEDYRHLAHLSAVRLRDKKLAALRNFKEHSVSITLGYTVAPEEQQDPERVRRKMRALIEYAMREDFVHGVAFRTVAALGAARERSSGDVMSSDLVMDEVVKASPVPIRREHVYVTQRLIQWVAGIVALPICEYVHNAVLFRVGGRWVGLDYFFDCDQLERTLDARAQKRPATRWGMIAALGTALLACARPTRIPALLPLGLKLLPVFLNRYDYASIPDGILPLNSSTVCDRYNLDSSVARRCEKTVHSIVDGKTLTESCSHMVIRTLRDRVAEEARQAG